MADTTVKPKAAARRFDTFAEYDRRHAAKQGQLAAQPKGYGLRLARLVAAQGLGRDKSKERQTGEPYGAMRDSLPASWKPKAK